MFVLDFFAAFIFAVIFMIILFNIFWKNEKLASTWMYFLIMLFSIWAAGIWIVPVGPVLWGSYWLPLVFIGLIVFLFLAIIPEGYRVMESDDGRDQSTTFVLWFIVILLALSIIYNYAWYYPII